MNNNQSPNSQKILADDRNDTQLTASGASDDTHSPAPAHLDQDTSMATNQASVPQQTDADPVSDTNTNAASGDVANHYATTVDQPSKKAKVMRLLILVLLIGVVGLGLWLANRPAPQQIQGMVESTTINVSTKVPSRVEQLMAEEGDKVKKGQILGVLTSPELQAKQRQAEGVLQSARALEQTAERGSQQENIASLKANWQSTLAQAELARVTYQRAQNLLNEGVISRQRRDEALAAKNSSAQLAEAAHQQYLRAVRGSTPEQLSSAQAQVKIAEAGVAEAKSLNQEMQLIAPEDGEVTEKFANVGELVPAGIPLYTLVDLRHQWVTINLREDQFNQLKHGSVLHGDIPALNQNNVAFQVSHIAAQGTFASWKATRQSSGYDMRTFEIKLKSLQPITGLRPGMSVLFDWPQTSSH